MSIFEGAKLCRSQDAKEVDSRSRKKDVARDSLYELVFLASSLSRWLSLTDESPSAFTIL